MFNFFRKKDRKTVVYIISLGHSGSTLLGSALGAHSRILHIGEILSPINKGFPVKCRSCQGQCPIWQDDVKEILMEEYNNFTNNNRKSFSSDNLYAALFKKNEGNDIIIDGTKNIKWAKYNANKLYDYKYIFLKRNILGVAASLNRAYNNLYNGLMKQLKDSISEIRNFYDNLPNDRKIIISYEKLVMNPELTLEKLCSFIGCSYENTMLEFYKSPDHIFGGNVSLVVQYLKNYDIEAAAKQANDFVAEGNRNYYMNLKKGFVLDTRWEHELSENDKLFITNNIKDDF